mgnify:CR=1 FL=1
MVAPLDADYAAVVFSFASGQVRQGEFEMHLRSHLVLAIVGCLPIACGTNQTEAPSPKGASEMEIEVSSPAFENGEPIPAKYTADGENVSPPIDIRGVPGETKSIALVCEDPDAPGGTFVHWIVFNLNATQRELPENITDHEALSSGAKLGKNDFGDLGYGGPAPPSGTHRYFFRVYALDTSLTLDSGATRKQLDGAVENHVIAQGELMGTYSRE